MADGSQATTFSPEQITKLMEKFKVPGVDVEALVAAQRKNIDALAKASHVATDGAAAASRHQVEFLQSAMEKITTMARDSKLAANEQREMATKAFEMALTNARELADLTRKATTEVYEVMQKRMAESLEEMRRAAHPKS